MRTDVIKVNRTATDFKLSEMPLMTGFAIVAPALKPICCPACGTTSFAKPGQCFFCKYDAEIEAKLKTLRLEKDK